MPVAAARARHRTLAEPRSPKSRGFSRGLQSPPSTGERAFAFAKACGIIGKSFVGKRVSALEKLHSLSELDRLIFPEASHELPEQELLTNLENRILQRTTRHIRAIINAYSSPPELLIRQLRACEYADVKTCLHSISSGKTTPPLLSDIGRFRTVHFKAYPDIAAMLAGTEFKFILERDIDAIKSPDFDFAPLEAELDLRYYSLLVQSIRDLPVEDCVLAQRILADEISLRNCVWALRLRTYFKKKPEDTAKYLMQQKMSRDPGIEISLATAAQAMLRFPLDSRSAWDGWRWESLLNPEKQGERWAADPRYFQNAASHYIYRLSMRSFRLMPFSVSTAFCFIKLKQFEEDVLTSITEGLGLGMTSTEIFDLVEAPL